MADYHAILKRAISSLPSPTGEARRAVYEKARTALVNQLKSFDPPIPASEITQQRLQLEDAIRKVESEVAKGMLRPKEPTIPPFPPAPVPSDPAQPPREATIPPMPAAVPEAAAPSAFVPAEAPIAPPPVDPAPAAEPRRPPHDLLASTEPPPTSFGREASSRPPRTKKPRRREAKEGAASSRARLPVLIGLAVAVLVVAVGVVALWSQREAISAFFGSNKAPMVDLAARSASEKLTPKATDRLGAEESSAKPQNGAAKPVPTQTITTTPQLQATAPTGEPPQQQAVALVGQTAILYEEGKVGGQAAIASGKVVWQTQPDPTDPRPGTLLLKARVEIPERGLVVLIQMHPNGDTSFPASHMVELKFNLPQGFEGKSITSVPGLILKADEQARGDALVGASAKVSENFFWIALSATDAERSRNLKFFRERGWIDVPVLYESGRRAILTLEKGGAGEKAVADAFASWGQSG
jgi:hypothetical protein